MSDDLQQQIDALEDKFIALSAAYTCLVKTLKEAGLPLHRLEPNLDTAAAFLKEDEMPGVVEQLGYLRDVLRGEP